MSLSGTTLRFDRSGRRLIILDPDEIAVVDATAQVAIRLPFRGARAVVGFDDELWIATCDEQLVRVDGTGAMLGAPVALPSAAHAVLTPAPCGPPAAVWSASSPVVCSASSAGQVVCAEAIGVDAVIPITGQRVIVARGSRLTLPSGLPVALAPNTQVLGGCVTADGKLLSLLVARGAERQLVGVALGLGQVTQRRTVPPRAAVVIAHGVAAIQIEPRVLRVIDLTTSRELGGVSFGHDVAAFAVGPTGRALAIRSTTGELELHRIDPLFPRPFTGARQASAAPAMPPDVPAPKPACAPEAPRAPAPTPLDSLAGLLPATLPDQALEIAPVAAPEPEAPNQAPNNAPIHSFCAPTAHATDWLCGSGDYLEGGP